MKKIEAFIRHEAFEPIRTELLDKGFPSLSISEVKGSGRQKGVVETYRGSTLTVNVRPKLKVECRRRGQGQGTRRRDDPQARPYGRGRRRQDLRPAGGGGDSHPHRRGGRDRAAGALRRGDPRVAGSGEVCTTGAGPAGSALARTWRGPQRADQTPRREKEKQTTNGNRRKHTKDRPEGGPQAGRGRRDRVHPLLVHRHRGPAEVLRGRQGGARGRLRGGHGLRRLLDHRLQPDRGVGHGRDARPRHLLGAAVAGRRRPGQGQRRAAVLRRAEAGWRALRGRSPLGDAPGPEPGRGDGLRHLQPRAGAGVLLFRQR